MKTLPIPFVAAILAGGLLLGALAAQSSGSQPPLPENNPPRTSQNPETGQVPADAKVTFQVKGMQKTKSGAT